MGKILWRRKWQLTSVFLSGKPDGHRSLAGYSPWGCKGVRRDLVTKQQLLIYNVVLISAVQKMTQLYTYIYCFLKYILFHFGVSQDAEYSSPCYIEGPCCLSIPYIIPYNPLCSPPWQPQVCFLHQQVSCYFTGRFSFVSFSFPGMAFWILVPRQGSNLGRLQ